MAKILRKKAKVVPKSQVLWLILIVVMVGIVLTGVLSAGLALFIGLSLTLLFKNPFAAQCRSYSTHCLKIAVVCMGFGMNITHIGQVALDTLWITLTTIIITFVLAWLIGRKLLLEKNTTILIGGGTAICGGSAIAAFSQVIKAKPEQITIAVTTIFLLNIIALYLFPVLGKWMALTEQQFGIWAALAIHDTSSVVGAAADFGAEALNIATTTKLSRALWIVPLTIIGALVYREGDKKVVLPMFILLFIGASVSNSLFPSIHPIFAMVAFVGKNLLIAALLLLGLGFTKTIFNHIDRKALILGGVLWMLISLITLVLVTLNY